MATLQKFKFLATHCAAVAGSPTRSPSASPVIHLRRRKTLRMLLSKTHSQKSKSSQNSSVIVAEKAQKVQKNVPMSFKLKDLLLSSPPPMKKEKERVLERVENGISRVLGGSVENGKRVLRESVESGKPRVLRESVENGKRVLHESVENGKTRALRECFEDGKTVENGKKVLQESVENGNSRVESIENGKLRVLFESFENDKRVLPGNDENGNFMIESVENERIRVLLESDKTAKRNLPESVENGKIKLQEAGGRVLVPRGVRGLRPLTATLRQRLLRKSWRPVLVGIPE